MNISRRALLGATILAPVALAGCGIVAKNTVNGITTITIDVARLDRLTQAVVSGGKTLLDNPLIAGSITPVMDTAGLALLSAISAAVAQIDAQAKGSQTLTFNATSVPAAVSSLESDVTALFKDVETGMSAVSGKVGATVTEIYDAFQTVVALVLALMPTVGVGAVRAGARPVMPEAKALKVLGVS